MKIIPRKKLILVKPDDEKSRISDHGIITPANSEQEKKSIGTVVRSGIEVNDIKKGDRVIYGTYAGDDIEQDGIQYKLIEEEFILAFIEN